LFSSVITVVINAPAMVQIIIIEVKVIVRVELVDQEQIQSLSEEHFLVPLSVDSMIVVLQLLLLHFLTPTVVFFCVI
jgi:hypothetical protein